MDSIPSPCLSLRYWMIGCYLPFSDVQEFFAHNRYIWWGADTNFDTFAFNCQH